MAALAIIIGFGGLLILAIWAAATQDTDGPKTTARFTQSGWKGTASKNWSGGPKGPYID